MTINLNDAMAFGYDIKNKKKREFQCMRITRSQNEFIEFSQYLIDSVPNTENIVFIDIKSQTVIDFTKFANGLKLKSKRYKQ